MERKINEDFGAYANRANANRNDSLVIDSALGNLQNFPDLDTIIKSKSKQDEIMALMKIVAVNSYKIGLARDQPELDGRRFSVSSLRFNV